MINRLVSRSEDPLVRNPALGVGNLKRSQSRSGAGYQERKRNGSHFRTILSESKQRIPVAIWSSMVSAQALTTFFEKNHKIARPDNLQFVSINDLAFMDQNRLHDYELVCIGCYDNDVCPPSAMKVMQRLSEQPRNQKSPTLTICRLGTGNSDTPWSKIIRDLSARCQTTVSYHHCDFQS